MLTLPGSNDCQLISLSISPKSTSPTHIFQENRLKYPLKGAVARKRKLFKFELRDEGVCTRDVYVR